MPTTAPQPGRFPPSLLPALVCGLALALRLPGLTWGLPDPTHLFSYHPDEYHSLRGLLSLVLAGDLNPHFFNYGSLYLYLVIVAVLLLHPGAALSAWGEQILTGQAGPLLRAWTLDARLVSVLTSVLTVYAVYLLGRRLMDHGGGLSSALLLAVVPLAVLLAHYGTVEATQALFITLSLYFCVLLFDRPGGRVLVWAGACAGLAASAKYNGGLVLVAPLLAAVLAPEPEGRRRTVVGVAGRIAVVLGSAALAFALTSPYTFLAWGEAQRDLAFEIRHMRLGEGLPLVADPSGFSYHLRHLLAPGLGPALLLAMAGAGWVVYRRERRWYPLLLFAVLWLITISLAKVRYPRYELALLPPLVLLAVAPLGFLRRGRRAWGIALGICLVAALGWSVQVSRGLQGPRPQDLAREHLLRVTQPGQSVGYVNDPWFADPPVDYLNGGTVLRSLPLWRGYLRPEREAVVSGLGMPTGPAGETPKAFVTTDFAVGEGLRAGDAATVEFMSRLAAQYGPGNPEAAFGGPPLSLVPWPLGPDWRYPWPQVLIWQMRGTR